MNTSFPRPIPSGRPESGSSRTTAVLALVAAALRSPRTSRSQAHAGTGAFDTGQVGTCSTGRPTPSVSDACPPHASDGGPEAASLVPAERPLNPSPAPVHHHSPVPGLSANGDGPGRPFDHAPAVSRLLGLHLLTDL